MTAMTPNFRKLALATHVTSSVGLLGSIAAFLVLATAGLNSQDTQIIRAAYLSMDLVARFIIVPLAFASLITGLIQSFGTHWGLFRHYWILTKLLLTAFAITILLVKLRMIGYAAHLAAETILARAELATVGMELRFHAAAGLLVLLVPVMLSMYKPCGLTPHGQRKQREQKELSQQQDNSPQHASRIPLVGVSASSGGFITFTLRRMQIFALLVAILVVHFLVLHNAGTGHVGH